MGLPLGARVGGGNKNVLELDSGDSCFQKVLKATEVYILKK